MSSHLTSQASRPGAFTATQSTDGGQSLINISPFDTRAPLVQFLPQRRQLAPDNIFNSLPGKGVHRSSEPRLAVELLGSDSETGELDLDLNSDEVGVERRCMRSVASPMFTQLLSPQARKVIIDFIGNNLASRKVWYERDDSEASSFCFVFRLLA